MPQRSFIYSFGLLVLLASAMPAAFAEDKLCLADDGNNQHKHAATHHKQAHAPEVKHSIIVKATPEQVWEAIRHQRKADDHRKLISFDGTIATLHETFAALPIVGEASCDYVETEKIPNQRMDYSLVKSDRFSVFEGSWILSLAKDGQSTLVELSNAIDAGIRVPFWQDITKMAASRSVKKRLDAVCQYAESLKKTESTNPIR
jgi:hypothetical protein